MRWQGLFTHAQARTHGGQTLNIGMRWGRQVSITAGECPLPGRREGQKGGPLHSGPRPARPHHAGRQLPAARIPAAAAAAALPGSQCGCWARSLRLQAPLQGQGPAALSRGLLANSRHSFRSMPAPGRGILGHLTHRAQRANRKPKRAGSDQLAARTHPRRPAVPAVPAVPAG